jgi:hypothetical protein
MIVGATEASRVYTPTKAFAYLSAIKSIVINSSSKLLMNVVVEGLGIRKRTLSTTKKVSVPSREPMQVHGQSPAESKPPSHGLGLPASVVFFPQLRLNHLPSKSLEPQIVGTQLKPGETTLSRRTHTSMLPIRKGLLLPRKQVATAFGAYSVLWVYRIGCQQLLGLLGTRRKGVLKD